MYHHRRRGRDEAALCRHGQGHAYGVSAAEYQRGRGLAHAGNELGYAQPRVHIAADGRSEEHTSELQSLMRISYAVFCLKKKKNNQNYDNAIIITHLIDR